MEHAGFRFFSDFDSANLAKVEQVPHTESIVVATSNTSSKSISPELPDAEFNLWTRPDCAGTEFENGNRTWFHFGVQASIPGVLVKFNLVDINRQSKMYSQGMCPVYRIVPGKVKHWERVRDKPTFYIDEDGIFVLSFKYRIPQDVMQVVYFAFTYPYTFGELQSSLRIWDARFLSPVTDQSNHNASDDIYYVRECVCNSLEGRRVDLITISSFHGITREREDRLKNLFPEENTARPYKFVGKKVIFVSARVHPGETPSSFVFNGFLNLLLSRDDPVAIVLRRMYVFKLIPFLNPDGVVKGHYRTDTRGINLNRVYLKPDFKLHPTIYAARAVLRYHHYKYEEKNEEEEETEESNSRTWITDENVAVEMKESKKLSAQVSHMTLEEQKRAKIEEEIDSGLFLYMDLHGHASKKGIFMYGNHFKDLEKNVECMLLPKLMSLNNCNFHFTNCNFTERNMYLRDRRDGLSREGSGRVSVLKMTGLVRSYTLECNYNTGRIVNNLPPASSKDKNTIGQQQVHHVPPKYTPAIFEEVGRAMGPSFLDLTGSNPLTRLPNSEFRTLDGLRDWLRRHAEGEVSSVVRKKMKGSGTGVARSAVRSLSAGTAKKPASSSLHHHQQQMQQQQSQSKPMRTQSSTTAERKENVVKLHEICYVKGNCGAKKLVAKYLVEGQQQKNLVVAWAETAKAAPKVVFSEKGGDQEDEEASCSSASTNINSVKTATAAARCFNKAGSKIGPKKKRLKINKPLTSAGKSKVDRLKSRKKLRAKLI